MRITGPTEVNEGAAALYTTRADFDNGLSYEITLFTTFTINPANLATINQFGQLTAGQVDQDTPITLNAAFTWGSVTKTASLVVTVIDQSTLNCTSPSYEAGRNFGGLGVETVRRSFVDAQGNAYLVGSFEATVDFDPTAGVDYRTAAAGTDGYLTRINANGSYGWTRVFAGSGNEVVNGVALGLDGSVHVVGHFSNAIDLDPGTGVQSRTTRGGNDFFVVKLTDSGSYLWGHAFGGTSADDAIDVAVDLVGDVVLVGSFTFTVDVDPGAPVVNMISNGQQRDMYALKLSSAGAYKWHYRAGGRQADEALAVCIDASRSIYFTGTFSAAADFDPGPGEFVMTVVGVTDPFIIRLNSDGLFQWGRSFGSPSTDGGTDITLTNSGDLLLCGYFWETADFDPGSGTFNIQSKGQSDAFVSRFTNAGTWLWSRAVGGQFMDEMTAVGPDGEGRIYAAGYFSSTVDFDPGAGVSLVTSKGQDDGFILKLGSTGGFNWVSTIGGTQSDQIRAVSADDTGLIYAAGTFRGSVDFDPTSGSDVRSSVGGPDAFMQVLRCGAPSIVDPFGCQSPSYVGALTVGGTGADQMVASVVAPDGARYVAGAFSGVADMNPGNGTDLRFSSGDTDVYLTRFDVNGDYDWSVSFGGLGPDAVSAVAVTSDGGVVLVGTFTLAVDFDPGVGVQLRTSAGGDDIYVSRFNADGALVWARTAGGLAEEEANGVAIDGFGSVLVAGSFQGNVDFDPGAGVAQFVSKGSDDLYVWKLNADGAYQWLYTVGKSQIDQAMAVAVDDANNVYATGWFQSQIDFDPGTPTVPLISNGATDVFIVSLNSAGGFRWVRGFGGPSTEIGYAIAVDWEGSIIAGGYFWDTVDFDPSAGVAQRTAVGQGDAWLLKLGDNGSFKWVRTAGGPDNEQVNAIAVDPHGDILAVGQFGDETMFDVEAGGALLGTYGSYDGFAWKLETTGDLAWVTSVGGGGQDTLVGVSVDTQGYIRIAGTFAGNAFVDPDGAISVPSAGGTDGLSVLMRCGEGLTFGCVGDLNCDGQVDFEEIDRMVIALQGQAVWQSFYPDCPWLNADGNRDGVVGFDDIDPIIQLIGSTCDTVPVLPEREFLRAELTRDKVLPLEALMGALRPE